LNKYIIEDTVRQVGHLPELYEDAQSEKYKKKAKIVLPCALTSCSEEW